MAKRVVRLVATPDVDGISDAAIDAMAAIFDLCEAIENGVSIGDLITVMNHAVEQGHEQMAVCLLMASMAASRVANEHAVR